MSEAIATSTIDLERYPIQAPESDAYLSLFNAVQTALEKDGCAVLKGFIKPEALPRLVAEADSASAFAYRSFNRTNAYFSQDDPALPESHPKRRFYDRSNAFIPADNFGSGSILRAVYRWQPLSDFLQAVLGEENFFPYGDPLADVIVNQAEEGQGFPWHFDTNNFTVTLALQNADQGGEFQYAPAIRTSTDENFEEVGRVLDATSDKVTTLVLEPGDLQLFKGRYSLHRVAPLRGQTKRYVGIFSYVEKPGMCGSVERTKQLYGKVLPIHYDREGLRADGLLD
jgi:hypothetical protein